MEFEVRDFNGSKEFFGGPGAARWQELGEVLHGTRAQLQPSDQKGKVGTPIFDPKATNAALTRHAGNLGWARVSVPADLRAFGKDWDAGKGSVLAEWQFSNYPFLWNNIIRSEAVFQSGETINPLTREVEALVIVTKSGSFPASNSTLYFEQANAQIDTVTTLGVFEIPIRLVGLMVPAATRIKADWNEYPARYGREAAVTNERDFLVSRGRAGQYGNPSTRFESI